MSKFIELDNGKYTIIYDENNQYPEKCLRYGAEWKNLTGDNLIFFLCAMIEDSNKCIVELYKLLDKIRTDAETHDISLVRIRGGASGCDMYQGKPPISRILDSILDKYDSTIHRAFKSIDQEESTNE